MSLPKNKNFDWLSTKHILASDKNLFSHILNDKRAQARRKKILNYEQPVNFLRMESPAPYNFHAPQVIKRKGKGCEGEDVKMEKSVNFEDYDEHEIMEMEELRLKIDTILEYWKVNPNLFWASEIRTLEDIERLHVSREESQRMKYELNKVLTIEKAIDESTFDELYNVIQEDERLEFRHRTESQRRRSTKKSLPEKFNLTPHSAEEVNEILQDREKQIVSDDTQSTISWRPEPHDSMIDSYIYKRQMGTLLKNSKLDWDKWHPYLGIAVTVSYLFILIHESWWDNFLGARTNRAIVEDYFHFSSDHFLPYIYQRCVEYLVQLFRISIAVVSFLPILAISYPHTIHSLCFYSYGLEFVKSFWETFQWTYIWFTDTGEGENIWEIIKVILGFLVRYILLAALIKFHYEMMKPGARYRERTNRIQWRHNEEIWFKSYSNLRMRMMAMRWMHNFSRYQHWNNVKRDEPEATKATWTDTKEFKDRIEEPGLDLADLFKAFRKEHRFKWMKVPGGWDDLEIFQSDPSISTDSDLWVRGPRGGQVFRDIRKRVKRRKYRRMYRGYAGDYSDKPYTKKRRYKQQEKGLRALLNRHGPQYNYPDTEEINKRLYWFRERMLVAFKRAVYQKGGGVYGGEGVSYGCLGPFLNDDEMPEWKVKKENANYCFVNNDG